MTIDITTIRLTAIETKLIHAVAAGEEVLYIPAQLKTRSRQTPERYRHAGKTLTHAGRALTQMGLITTSAPGWGRGSRSRRVVLTDIGEAWHAANPT